MRKYASFLLLALAACADTSGGSGSTGTDDFGDTSDDGLDVETGSESTSATETTGTTDSSSEETGDGDGDGESSGDGDGDGEETSSGDGDGDSTSSGDGDGDTGMTGEEKFPFDLCDPFIGDTCLDTDMDYECIFKGEFVEGNPGDIEYVFRCEPLNTDWDGQYGDPCLYQHYSCRAGMYCASESAFENGNCSGTGFSCCTDICTFGDVCGNGMECEVTAWQAFLADYLDIYTGIGYCPEV